jgi:sugar phosphate isomerase/epimerase
MVSRPPEIDRRSLIAAGLGLAFASVPALARPRDFFSRHGIPLGVQFYTVQTVTQKDVQGAFERLARLGYRDMELPSMLGRQPAELRAMADRAGLRISALHVTYPDLSKRSSADGALAALAKDLHVLGADHAVAPMPPWPSGLKPARGESFGDTLGRGIAAEGPDFWKRMTDVLNRCGAELRREGIRLGYHNHNVEFRPMGDSNGWDILVDGTDPKLVSFELDAGWVAAAGIDPVALVRRHGGRLRLMHIKDIKGSTRPNFALTMDPTEVGSGVIDWKRLLPAAYKAGVRHFYVEQEPPFPGDPFESLAKSRAYLTSRV